MILLLAFQAMWQDCLLVASHFCIIAELPCNLNKLLGQSLLRIGPLKISDGWEPFMDFQNTAIDYFEVFYWDQQKTVDHINPYLKDRYVPFTHENI
jgi:hypothetical protein